MSLIVGLFLMMCDPINKTVFWETTIQQLPYMEKHLKHQEMNSGRNAAQFHPF